MSTQTFFAHTGRTTKKCHKEIRQKQTGKGKREKASGKRAKKLQPMGQDSQEKQGLLFPFPLLFRPHVLPPPPLRSGIPGSPLSSYGTRGYLLRPRTSNPVVRRLVGSTGGSATVDTGECLQPPAPRQHYASLPLAPRCWQNGPGCYSNLGSRFFIQGGRLCLGTSAPAVLADASTFSWRYLAFPLLPPPSSLASFSLSGLPSLASSAIASSTPSWWPLCRARVGSSGSAGVGGRGERNRSPRHHDRWRHPGHSRTSHGTA